MIVDNMTFNNIPLTENEKRIITLLHKQGPLSKAELSQYGEMGWATVVKFINRLQELKIIECTGTSPKTGKKGKNSYIYNLNEIKPLAIGLDIEYKTTSIILTNLKGQVYSIKQIKTPDSPSPKQLSSFLHKNIVNFIKQNEQYKKSIIGVGIGIPNIGISDWIINCNNSFSISRFLEDKLQLKVVLEINTRAYTVYEKWNKKMFSYDDFFFVSIRTGVGSGIFINGNLYTGSQGFAGEIGHLRTIPNSRGLLCRCGNYGCLETEINQYQLFNKYYEAVKMHTPAPSKPPLNELYHSLSNLFTLAKQGNEQAYHIVKQTAEYLGYALSQTIMVLNISTIIISGHFGPDGDILVSVVDQVIRKNILPKMNYSIEYYPFDKRGHTLGAALLILKEFFTDIPNRM